MSLKSYLVKVLPSLAISGLVCWLAWNRLVVLGGADAKSIASALLSAAAAFIGVVVAAASVLVTSGGRQIIKNMRASGHYTGLVKEMKVSLLLFGLSSAALIWALFATQDDSPLPASVGIGLLVLSSIHFFALCFKLALVGRSLARGHD